MGWLITKLYSHDSDFDNDLNVYDIAINIFTMYCEASFDCCWNSYNDSELTYTIVRNSLITIMEFYRGFI